MIVLCATILLERQHFRMLSTLKQYGAGKRFANNCSIRFARHVPCDGPCCRMGFKKCFPSKLLQTHIKYDFNETLIYVTNKMLKERKILLLF